MVTLYTTRFNIKNAYILHTHTHMAYLRDLYEPQNSDDFPTQNKLVSIIAMVFTARYES